MKRKLAAAVAVLLVLLAGGAAVGVKQVTDSGKCMAPLTLFGSEQTASIAALEAYISENIAPGFKLHQYLSWESDDYSPVLLPNKISARIVVGDGQKLVYYHVTLVRSCQGGDWKVIEFKRV